MTIKLQYESPLVPVSALVTLAEKHYTFPIRKSVEGWESTVPSGFPRENSMQAQIAIAAALLRL